MIWFYLALALVAAIIIFIISTSFWAYRKTFYSSKNRAESYEIPHDAQYLAEKDKILSLIDEMNALPFEQVFITSFDGTQLAARYYHIKDDAPLQIQFHGYRGSAIRDFCGGNKLARESNFNTLVVDQRAHGLSKGKVITFGIKERFDCLEWVKYAVKRFPETPIFLAGVSMGAATVLMASDLNMPPNVKGIIADCPYSSPAAIIKKVCRDKKLPKIAYNFIKIGARWFGKFDLEESSAAESVKHSKIPILLLHGEADNFVPCDMSREIAQNCGAKLYTFPGAGHGISYILDPKRYADAVHDFVLQRNKTILPCDVPPPHPYKKPDTIE